MTSHIDKFLKSIQEIEAKLEEAGALAVFQIHTLVSEHDFATRELIIDQIMSGYPYHRAFPFGVVKRNVVRMTVKNLGIDPVILKTDVDGTSVYSKSSDELALLILAI